MGRFVLQLQCRSFGLIRGCQRGDFWPEPAWSGSLVSAHTDLDALRYSNPYFCSEDGDLKALVKEPGHAEVKPVRNQSSVRVVCCYFIGRYAGRPEDCIGHVAGLGCQIQPRQEADGLHLQLPAQARGKYAYAFRVLFDSAVR